MCFETDVYAFLLELILFVDGIELVYFFFLLTDRAIEVLSKYGGKYKNATLIRIFS